MMIGQNFFLSNFFTTKAAYKKKDNRNGTMRARKEVIFAVCSLLVYLVFNFSYVNENVTIYKENNELSQLVAQTTTSHNNKSYNKTTTKTGKPPYKVLQFPSQEQETMEGKTIKCSNRFNKYACVSNPNCKWKRLGILKGSFECIYSPLLLQNDASIALPQTRMNHNKKKQSVDGVTVSDLDDCTNQKIANIIHDPCYSNGYANKKIPLEQCSCHGLKRLDDELKKLPHSNEITYEISQPKNRQDYLMSEDTLKNELIFIFIHVNKAAGETMKNIMFESISQYDGAGFGTKQGWKYLEKKWWPKKQQLNQQQQEKPITARKGNYSSLLKSTLNYKNRDRAIYFRCGKNFSSEDDVKELVLSNGVALEQVKECPLRFVWGNSAMGLCDHFPGQPCAYFLILRDPLTRALSDYEYFCKAGAENKKKWTKQMVKNGKCEYGLIQWFKEMKTSPYFYVERLTRGCDETCGVKTAIGNLLHPCVRYLILEKFDHGLEMLGKHFGGKMNELIAHYRNKMEENKQVNRNRNFNKRSTNYSTSVLGRLKIMLSEDYEVYNKAVENYESQWNHPVQSCNMMLNEKNANYLYGKYLNEEKKQT